MSGEQIEIGGTLFAVDAWEASAANTVNPPTAPAGEWCLQLEMVNALFSAAYADSTTGAIDFGSDGTLTLMWQDRPGASPFVLVRLTEGDAGASALRVRYSSTAAGWSDWFPLPWDAQNGGYVHIGPASDGSLGAAGLWGHIQVGAADSAGWICKSARAGWADIGG